MYKHAVKYNIYGRVQVIRQQSLEMNNEERKPE